MSVYRHKLASQSAHIWTLRAGLVVMLVIAGGLWYGWHNAPDKLTIHIPPTLRTGSTRAWWKVPPSSVYAFAFYVWQQINHWPKNGRVDYKANLAKYRPYLTPACERYLHRDYHARERRHELNHRVRAMSELPGQGYSQHSVQVLSRNSWNVRLNLDINEYLHGTRVRSLYMHYVLRVVRADVDPQHNPWGLQINCFAKTPVRMDANGADGASGPHQTKGA